MSQCSLNQLRNLSLDQVLARGKKRHKRANDDESRAKEAAESMVAFFKVTQTALRLKAAHPLIASRFGHNDKPGTRLTTTSTEFLCDVWKITSAVLSDEELVIYLSILKREGRLLDAQSDEAAGMDIEMLRLITSNETRLVEKLGGVYRQHDLHKYFNRVTKQTNGYSVGAA